MVINSKNGKDMADVTLPLKATFIYIIAFDKLKTDSSWGFQSEIPPASSTKRRKSTFRRSDYGILEKHTWI